MADQVYFAFAASSSTSTSFLPSFTMLMLFHSASCLITPMIYPSSHWTSRSSVRCFEQVRVFRGPKNAEGVPISLVKWGWGGLHITRDMGTVVPISRGPPYRTYTGPVFIVSLWGGERVGKHRVTQRQK